MSFLKFIKTFLSVVVLMFFVSGCATRGVNLVDNGSTSIRYKNFPKSIYPDTNVYQDGEKLLVTGYILGASSADLDVTHLDISIYNSEGDLITESSTSLRRKKSIKLMFRKKLVFSSSIIKTLPKKSVVVVGFHNAKHPVQQ